MSEVPPGFQPLFRSSPVIDLIGPVYSKGSRLAFANCYIRTGETRIVRASAVFVVAGELAER